MKEKLQTLALAYKKFIARRAVPRNRTVLGTGQDKREAYQTDETVRFQIRSTPFVGSIAEDADHLALL